MEDEKVSSEILALKRLYRDPYPSCKKKGVVTESRESLTRV
ncbi:MAG: hypothetical protein CM15mP58_01900 [Burkholderiaceae bacterium]|nr:MAG: hypothetical protein CM15mP58_01900 [Burkholderiaceae bacterium]